MNNTGWRILGGLPHNEGRPFLNRVAKARFKRIVTSFTKNEGDYVYSGYRCSPENVADRFAGSVFRKFLGIDPFKGFIGTIKYIVAVVFTKLGLLDKEIEATWHERASSEYYYMYEKDW